MGDSDSVGALSALMQQQQPDQALKKPQIEEDLGKDTLAGYISDSVKATPLAANSKAEKQLAL